MLVIGLTGSIGTGKSEVARLLESLGAELINADLVGHEAYAPNTEGWRQVVEAFGRDILQPSGEVDRRKLGTIVFSDPEQMAKLNAIMHPRIAEMVGERIEKLRDQGKEVVVVEAALLFEAKWDYLVDEVWSTDAPVETVIQRLRDRNGLEEEEVRKRIDSQMDREERLARSDLVVDNSGDVAALEQTVSSLWKIRVNQRTVRR
ncbi:MAG: dephospho-CoA kinase [Chloroflexi bacterium]|nr:dephospho-CoA kinase [Chloroflexota bacterium]